MLAHFFVVGRHCCSKNTPWPDRAPDLPAWWMRSCPAPAHRSTAQRPSWTTAGRATRPPAAAMPNTTEDTASSQFGPSHGNGGEPLPRFLEWLALRFSSNWQHSIPVNQTAPAIAGAVQLDRLPEGFRSNGHGYMASEPPSPSGQGPEPLRVSAMSSFTNTGFVQVRIVVGLLVGFFGGYFNWLLR